MQFPRFLLATALLVGPAAAQCETAKLKPPRYQGFLTLFGSYVDVDGDTAVVGGTTPNGIRAAFLFERRGFGWSLDDVVLIPAPGFLSARDTPVAISGDTVLLGHFERYAEAGAAYVVERAAGYWSETQELRPGTPIADSHFGRRLALDGERAVIAAPMDEHFAYRGGAVFVFERTARGRWIERARLDPPEPRTLGFYGLSVALEGDLLAVGEPGYPVSPTATGRLHVYRHGATGWTLEERIEEYGIGFAYAVSVDRGHIAVGAFRDGGHAGAHEGSVRLYEHLGSWTQVDELRSTHPDGDDHFGAAVELEGDRLAVGSGASELGFGERVHIYERSAGEWVLRSVLAPHDDVGGSWYGPVFGCSLAIDGDDFWVGSPADTEFGGADMGGAAYVHTFEDLSSRTCDPAHPNSTGLPGELDSRGCATLARNDLVLRASQLPPQQVAAFLVSRSADFVPFAGGGQGDLCLGGPIGRYSPPASSGALGSVDLDVDLEALPVPGGTYAAVAGQTWFFQCWYRDANPGPTSNLTNGLAASVR